MREYFNINGKLGGQLPIFNLIITITLLVLLAGAEESWAAPLTGINDIFFDPNQSNIEPDELSVLKKNAKVLIDNPQATILLEGYSDRTGEDQYNVRLSVRRAESVKRALVDLGINPNRIKTVGKGKTNKFAVGESAESNQKNRRVRFVTERVETAEPLEKEKEEAQEVKATPEPVEVSEEADESELPVGEIVTTEEPEVTPETEPEAGVQAEVDEIDNVEEDKSSTPTPPPLVSNAIKAEIKEVAPGVIIFDTPGEMSVGESYLIKVDLPYEFIKKLASGIKGSNVKELRALRLTQELSMNLSGRGFRIQPGDGTEVVDENAGTESNTVTKSISEGTEGNWHWFVTPFKSGVRSLVLSVGVTFENAKFDETTKEFPVFQKLIEVRSGLFHSAKSGYLILGSILILIFVAAYLLSRQFRVD